MKMIAFNKCSECPHHHTGGGHGSPQYIPYCTAGDNRWRELPYTKGVGLGNRVTARLTDTIPEWCPLPEMQLTTSRELLERAYNKLFDEVETIQRLCQQNSTDYKDCDEYRDLMQLEALLYPTDYYETKKKGNRNGRTRQTTSSD